MKLVLLLLVVLAGAWLWRNNRRETMARRRPERRAADQPAQVPEDMVRCAACGVHVPRTDALPGPGGHYCCVAHRDERGR